MTAGEGGSYKGKVRKDLAALLAEEGTLPAEVLERAIVRQRDVGGALDTALLELGALDEERLVGLLSRASGLPAAPPEAWAETDARARRVFPSRVAERHGLAPFRLDGRELRLAATHPVDLAILDELSFMLSLHLTAHVGPEWRVRQLIHRLYGGALPPRFSALASGGPPVPPLPALAVSPASRQAQQAAEAPAELLEGLDIEDVLVPGPEGDPAADAGATGAPPGGAEPGDGFGAPEPAAFTDAHGHEPPPLPAVFEEGEEDPLAAALEQAVEAVELGFLDDVEVDEGAADEGHPAGEEHRATEPEPAPAELDRSAPPRWSLGDARAALDAARHRDGVVLAALRYTRDFFQYAALFAVARDAFAGHDALGEEDGARDIVRTVALYASEPGVLRTVMETGGPYLGPVTREPGTDAVLRGLARPMPRTVFVFPVLVRGRIVCLVYADNGEAPVSARRLGDLLTMLSGVGGAFERVLLAQKRRGAAEEPVEPETWRTREPARLPQPDPAILGGAEEVLAGATPEASLPFAAAPAPEPAVEAAPEPEPIAPPAGDEPPTGEVPLTAEEPAASPLELEPAEPYPAEAAPEAADEAAELERATAEALAAVEAAREPEGLPPRPRPAEPPVRRPPPLPAAPTPAAPAAPPSAPEPSGSPDVEVTFVEAPDTTDEVALPPPEETLGSLADKAFSTDPAVASNAVANLAARRHEHGLRDATDRLRRGLLSGLSLRTASAARALAALRDVEAVPLMVQVLEKADPQAADAVAAALRAITMQPLGKDPMRWLLWWKENRGRGRAEWLFGALTHPLKEIRLSAYAELSETAPPPVEYDPDWDLPRLQQATADWAAWWAKSGLVI
ncbi:MAG: hypothetical protein U0229_21425 [Anaeromyxobacter sp.]